MTDQTCAERVKDHYRSRISDLHELWDAYCKGEEDVEDLGNIWEYGLCFDYVPQDTFRDQGSDRWGACSLSKGYFRYQLSCGGPADEFRFYVGYDGKPYRIEYWFLDWFDGACVSLESADFDLLLEIFNWFDEGGAVNRAYKDAVE